MITKIATTTTATATAETRLLPLLQIPDHYCDHCRSSRRPGYYCECYEDCDVCDYSGDCDYYDCYGVVLLWLPLDLGTPFGAELFIAHELGQA